jgi:hypothetical protein
LFNSGDSDWFLEGFISKLWIFSQKCKIQNNLEKMIPKLTYSRSLCQLRNSYFVNFYLLFRKNRHNKVYLKCPATFSLPKGTIRLVYPQSVCLSICLSVSLSASSLSVYQSVCLSAYSSVCHPQSVFKLFFNYFVCMVLRWSTLDPLLSDLCPLMNA